MVISQNVTFRRNLDFGVTYSRLPRQPDLACEAYMGYYRPLALLLFEHGHFSKSDFSSKPRFWGHLFKAAPSTRPSHVKLTWDIIGPSLCSDMHRALV